MYILKKMPKETEQWRKSTRRSVNIQTLYAQLLLQLSLCVKKQLLNRTKTQKTFKFLIVLFCICSLLLFLLFFFSSFSFLLRVVLQFIYNFLLCHAFLQTLFILFMCMSLLIEYFYYTILFFKFLSPNFFFTAVQNILVSINK